MACPRTASAAHLRAVLLGSALGVTGFAPRAAAQAPPAALPAPAPPAEAPAPSPTSDESAPGVAEARRRYAQGVAFFHAARFEEAIVEFNEAWSLWQNPTVLHALAQSHERLLHVPRAIFYYTRYLSAAPATAANRDEVIATVRDLRALLSDLDVRSNVVARVFADGEEVGEAPGAIRLALGRHEIELRAEGYVTERQTLTLAARTRRELTFHLSPTPPPVTPPTRLRPIWFWVGTGVTAATAVTSVTLGMFTLAASSEYQSDAGRSVERRDEGRRLALATDVSLAATALFGIALVVIGLNTGWSDPARPRVTVAVDPAGRVGLGGSF
ncbi:MAG: PEGA domain-containing protein [Polyangiales bacterium]